MLDVQWEWTNTLGNNPVKEEPCPLVGLLLEKIAKAPHEIQEHHVFVVKEYVK